MRQQLPEEAGYPLAVPGVGTVDPGQKFDAPSPVPGCILLDEADGTGSGVSDENDHPSPGMQDAADAPSATEGVESPGGEDSGALVPARRTGRRAASKEDSA